MVEMPGIREPERVRKLLQGSANLEFWETYNSNEVIPMLSQLDQRFANGGEAVAEDSAAVDTAAVKAEADAAKAEAAKPKFEVKKDAKAEIAKTTETDEKALAAAQKAHPLLFLPT